jgi:uncharacterized protein (DUF433 family)
MHLTWTSQFVADPRICGGQLCAKGTRIPLTVILDSLAEGLSVAAVLKQYPALKPAHLQAAIAYAADLAREEEITPLSRHAGKARREPARGAR